MAETTRTSTGISSAPPTGRHPPFLEDAEQLRLAGRRQLPHLVEEQGASLGLLEQAGPVGVGAREGPPAVTEEMGLEQVLRHGGAVDGDEGTPSPRRVGLVQQAGDELLAGAALADDEHVHPRVRGRGPPPRPPLEDRTILRSGGARKWAGRRYREGRPWVFVPGGKVCPRPVGPSSKRSLRRTGRSAGRYREGSPRRRASAGEAAPPGPRRGGTELAMASPPPRQNPRSKGDGEPAMHRAPTHREPPLQCPRQPRSGPSPPQRSSPGFRERQHAQRPGAAAARGRRRGDRPAPGRERHRQGGCWPGSCTTAAPAPAAPSSRSTARPFPRVSSSRSCSGTRRAPSPGRCGSARAAWSRPAAGRCSSTRWAPPTPGSSSGCCGSFRSAATSVSAATTP